MRITSKSEIASRLSTATLISSKRITPASSREDVQHLAFRTYDLSFDCELGQCLYVMAPGQYGNKYHPRLYSVADVDRDSPDSTDFALCVRRCSYIDEVNGEEYPGVASNYLCDLKPGDTIEFSGPTGYPFEVPTNKDADIVMIGMGTGIAPFRGLVKRIYEKHGGWKGRVRLYYGAQTGLDLLYMNDENNDLANYYDQETFRAFQAVSLRPHFNEPANLDKIIEQNAGEMKELLQRPGTRVYLAGVEVMQAMVDKAMSSIVGSEGAWKKTKAELESSGRWSEVLY
jgi:sulfite reductase alpha subunit-like flavoprotein